MTKEQLDKFVDAISAQLIRKHDYYLDNIRKQVENENVEEIIASKSGLKVAIKFEADYLLLEKLFK